MKLRSFFTFGTRILDPKRISLICHTGAPGPLDNEEKELWKRSCVKQLRDKIGEGSDNASEVYEQMTGGRIQKSEFENSRFDIPVSSATRWVNEISEEYSTFVSGVYLKTENSIMKTVGEVDQKKVPPPSGEFICPFRHSERACRGYDCPIITKAQSLGFNKTVIERGGVKKEEVQEAILPFVIKVLKQTDLESL